MYIPIENISRGIDEPSNPLLTRTIGHFHYSWGFFYAEIQQILMFRLQ